MCGRYSLATPDPSALRARFPLGESVELRRRYNVAPGDGVAAVTTDREGSPRGEVLRWGLVPHWAKDPAVGYRTINARAETVAERPAFRDAFRSRRCLIVADGFFEWQRRPGQPKQPWWITREDAEPFAFAGLWATWHGPEGLVLRTCTIVTTQANTLVRELHDRMPVILQGPAAEARWLDHDAQADELLELLVPLPDAATARRAVSSVVNDARNDVPECLKPVLPDALF